MVKKAFILFVLLLSSRSLFAKDYWIDVRIQPQYQYQHIDGAINLPLSELRQKAGRIIKNKDDTIHVYCNSGNQSAIAKSVLNNMGYTNVIDEGGFEDASDQRQKYAELEKAQAESKAEESEPAAPSPTQ